MKDKIKNKKRNEKKEKNQKKKKMKKEEKRKKLKTKRRKRGRDERRTSCHHNPIKAPFIRHHAGLNAKEMRGGRDERGG